MTRILHLTRDLPPRVRGGLSTAVGGLVAAAARRGLNQVVLSFDAWRPRAGGVAPALQPETREDGVPVLRIGQPAALLQARDGVRAWSPDRIVVHDAMLWEFAEELRVELGAPAALFVHVVQAALSALRRLEARTASEVAQAFAVDRADAIWLPSEAARTLLAAHHPAAAARAVVLPLGIETRGGDATARPGEGGAGTEAPPRQGVLLVGRFDVVKGTADLLGAAELLVASHPGVHVRLVGGLPDTPPAERRWQRRWRVGASQEAQAAVSFLGWRDAEGVAEEQARAAIVVAPSHQETFGLAALEAMQAGAALVASDIAAHRELVEDGVTGILVPVGDRAALAAAIGGLLDDPVRAARLGEAARTRVVGTSLWDRRIDAHLGAMRGLRAPASTAPPR